MKNCHWRVSAVALLLGAAGLLASTIEDAGKRNYDGFLSSAHAQPLRKLIARLRGQTLPDGIAKAEGRIEATQVDVSSKYAGQLAEFSVEEGTKVTIGQVIGRVSSPEFEAQLRAAQSDLQAAHDALAGAEAEIASRRSALEFAKSDFERGEALMKSGYITKQLFEERQRNYESADAAVINMTARRDEAQNAIKSAEAKVQEIDSMIQDLTLVSPRNGQVQYQMARKGETVAVGEPIVTILDLTDVYMVIFLNAADAGRLGVGDEARVIHSRQSLTQRQSIWKGQSSRPRPSRFCFSKGAIRNISISLSNSCAAISTGGVGTRQLRVTWMTLLVSAQL